MKKWVSVFLTLVMILSILPLGAMPVSAATSNTSGKVGNYTWSFNESTGMLKLTGSGNMPSFSSIDPPWSNYYDRIKSVYLPNGLTNIGDRAFLACSNLTLVTIPDSVTNIGNYAFSGCSSLTSVTIPSGVTSIGGSTFSGCTNLASVSIPSSVTNIGDHAFSDCTNLTSITIPSGVTSISVGAFSGCSSLSSVTIPNGVTGIGNAAFSDCTNLTSVTIPSSVTGIGIDAFRGCTNLTSITIPSGVTIIWIAAFYGCSSLKSITVYSTDCDFRNCGLNYTHTIYGFKGSTAESFANSIGATFVDLETVHTHKYTNSCDTDCDVDVCGKTRTIAASTHKFGAWKQTKAPTKTQDGEEKRVCANAGCTHSETRAIAALGYDNDETTKKPTTTTTTKAVTDGTATKKPSSDATQKPKNTTTTTTGKHDGTADSSTSSSSSSFTEDEPNGAVEDAYADAPVDEMSPALPFIILGACAAVAAAAVIGALIWSKKKKPSAK